MNLNFLSLTWDTKFLILLRLPLNAIVSLRKTCRQLNEVISKDKQLWMMVLERDVLSRNVNLHPLRIQSEVASAAHVESWVRCAFQLQRTYQEGTLPVVTRIKLELRITWLKIMRTCWCLVASSSENESHLTIWDLRCGGTISREYYLPGPVIDGTIDDNGRNIFVALTIGTMDMYVHVLSICSVAGDVAIISLAEIRDVSYVRSLNGPWIACAVRHGDDTFPVLVNWTENCSWKLELGWYIEHAQLPWGNLHCAICTATQWMDWIVVIMNKSVEIFRLADFERPKDQVAPIASLPVVISRSRRVLDCDSLDIEEASFHKPEGHNIKGGRAILSFSCRIKNGLYSLFSITSVDSGFSIHEGQLKELERSDELLCRGNMLISGSSSNFEVHLRTEGGFDLLPSLKLVKLERNVSENAFVGASYLRAIKEGFPLLHFTTSMDFDDGVGLLALGTCKGYLCIARFLPEEMITIGSLMDGLPTECINGKELSIVPVETNLPSYCMHVQKSKQDFDVPPHVIEETVQAWSKGGSGRATSPPWSDDWLHYEDIRHWVVPQERWPLNDAGGFYFKSFASLIRQELTVLGDIIPLAYRRDPDVVLFHVGQRYYMVWILRLDEDDLEFEYGALSTLDEQSSLDGDALEALRWSGVRNNLLRYGNRGKAGLLDAAEAMDILVDAVSRHTSELELELSKAGSDPNFWTQDELEQIFEKARIWVEWS